MVYAKQAQKTFFGVQILVFSQIDLRKSDRNFFHNPPISTGDFCSEWKTSRILEKI